PGSPGPPFAEICAALCTLIDAFDEIWIAPPGWPWWPAPVSPVSPPLPPNVSGTRVASPATEPAFPPDAFADAPPLAPGEPKPPPPPPPPGLTPACPPCAPSPGFGSPVIGASNRIDVRTSTFDVDRMTSGRLPAIVTKLPTSRPPIWRTAYGPMSVKL